jgi:hypothetical protein
MSPRFRTVLLAVSLALNVGFIATAVQRHWLNGGTDAPPTPLAQRLGLTAGQQTAWTALEGPFLKDLAVNWAAIRAQRQALLDEIFAAHPDAARLAGIQERIATLQDEQQKRVIRQLLAEREVLDARQQVLLKDLLGQEFSAQPSQAEQLHQKPPGT